MGVRVTNHNAKRFTILLIALTSLFRLVMSAWTGLGTGESYYFRGAKFLDLSYFDQPPLFFWLSGGSVRLLGETAFALRLPTVMLFAGTCWMLYVLGKRFYNARAGFYAVVAINMCAVFTISIGMWFQPDSPLMFFWLLCTWCLVQVLFPQKRVVDAVTYRKSGYVYLWWGLVGVTMGLTTLSKYHVVFLLAGVFLFALTRKSHRHWLWHPGPYIALIINFAIATPVFLWNAEHDWVSFVFQASRAGKSESALHFDWVLRSIGGQALWLLPWIWLPLVFQLPRIFKKGKHDLRSWFLFWIAVLPIVFFTIIPLWSNLQFHFHWQAPGYLMLFLPLGAQVAKNLDSIGKWKIRTKRWLYASAGVTFICFTVLTVHMTTGVWSSYGPKWFAGLFGETIDPTIDGTDFDNIHVRFEEEGWLSDTNIFVASPRWWMAGKTDWALRAKKDVVILHRDPRNFAFLIDPRRSIGKDAIIIGRGHWDTVQGDMAGFFDEVKQLDDIWVTRAGVKELPLEVYYAKNFQLPDPPMDWIPVYWQLKGERPFIRK